MNFSTAFYPKSVGESEEAIQTLDDMLGACVIELGENWDDQ